MEEEYLMDMDWDEKLEPTTATVPYRDEKSGLVLTADLATFFIRLLNSK